MKAVNRSVKSWLQDNIIEINPVHNEGKSVAAERCITLLKKKTSTNDFIIKICVY